jgi:hypothetical protein
MELILILGLVINYIVFAYIFYDAIKIKPENKL